MLFGTYSLLQCYPFHLELGVDVLVCISLNPKKEIEKEVSVFLSKIRS